MADFKWEIIVSANQSLTQSVKMRGRSILSWVRDTKRRWMANDDFGAEESNCCYIVSKKWLKYVEMVQVTCSRWICTKGWKKVDGNLAKTYYKEYAYEE